MDKSIINFLLCLCTMLFAPLFHMIILSLRSEKSESDMKLFADNVRLEFP